MKSCIPKFNASRMVMDYVKTLYTPATIHYKKLKKDNSAPAKLLASWKAHIRAQWRNISIERMDDEVRAIKDGESLPIKVQASLNGLSPEDVTVKCLVVNHHEDDDMFTNPDFFRFKYDGMQDGKHIFSLDLKQLSSGINYYRICIFPYHKLLAHPLETGFMIWL